MNKNKKKNLSTKKLIKNTTKKDKDNSKLINKDRLYFNSNSLWNKNQLNINLKLKLLTSNNTKKNEENLNDLKDKISKSKKIDIFLKNKIKNNNESSKNILQKSKSKSIRNNYFYTLNNSVSKEISKIKHNKNKSIKKEYNLINKQKIEKSINTKDTKINYEDNIINNKIRNKYDFNHMHKIMNFWYKDKYLLQKRNNIRNKLKIFKEIVGTKYKENSYDMIEDYIKMECSKTDSINNYELIKNIGNGGYSCVKLSINKKNNIKYALKYFEKGSLLNLDKFLNLKNEIISLKKSSSKRIIKLFNVLDSNKYIILVLEYVSSSSLFDYLIVNKNNKNEDYKNNLKNIFKNIVKGVLYLHKNNIIHGDLKPENIIIYKKNKIKIIDFGFSKIIKNDQLITNYCGTPQFIAPEIILKKPYEGKPIDIWALGILLYKIFYGKYPFNGTTNNEIFHKILCFEKNKIIYKNKDIDKKIIKILNNIIIKNPNKRMNIKKLLKEIKNF